MDRDNEENEVDQQRDSRSCQSMDVDHHRWHGVRGHALQKPDETQADENHEDVTANDVCDRHIAKTY